MSRRHRTVVNGMKQPDRLSIQSRSQRAMSITGFSALSLECAFPRFQKGRNGSRCSLSVGCGLGRRQRDGANADEPVIAKIILFISGFRQLCL